MSCLPVRSFVFLPVRPVRFGSVRFGPRSGPVRCCPIQPDPVWYGTAVRPSSSLPARPFVCPSHARPSVYLSVRSTDWSACRTDRRLAGRRFVRPSVRTFVRTHVYPCVHVSIRPSIRPYLCLSVNLRICACMFVCACICVCVLARSDEYRLRRMRKYDTITTALPVRRTAPRAVLTPLAAPVIAGQDCSFGRSSRAARSPRPGLQSHHSAHAEPVRFCPGWIVVVAAR